MKLLYYVLCGFMWLIMLLPLGFLYRISDFAFIIIFYIIKYRRKVVQTNLKNAFPEKTESELKKIEYSFYRHFCDMFIEPLKMLNFSEKEIKKRVKFVNPEALDEYYKNNQSVFINLGHYGNWEWLSYAWTAIHPEYTESYKMYPAYYPLRNKYAEKFIFALRTKAKSVPIPQKRVPRTIIKLQQDGLKGIFIFIADQSPIWNSVHHWMTFLNQSTATITGPEALAKQFGNPVFYLHIVKPKRGHYICEYIKITDQPKTIPNYGITELYMTELEKSIKADPSLWLWTHKRWKLNKAAFENN